MKGGVKLKTKGLCRELLIHPGETVADVLENRGITQHELALRAGVTAAYVNKVIKGEKDISAKFAMGLEYALGVHKSFWLNLQADYDAEYLEVVENETVRADEIKLIPRLDEICKYFVKKKEMPKALNDTERVIWLRHILGLSNIASVYEIAEEGTFKMEKASDIDEAVLGAWIRLCQKKCEFHCTENEPPRSCAHKCAMTGVSLAVVTVSPFRTFRLSVPTWPVHTASIRSTGILLHLVF